MAKFNDDRRDDGGRKKNSKSNYKAKRSFSKNKSLRDKQTSGRGPFKKDFERERPSFEERGKRDWSKDKPFKKRFNDEGDKPRGERPFSKKSPSDKKRFNDEYDRPRGDKPFKKKFNEGNDRSRNDRGKRPQGDRPFKKKFDDGDRPRGDKPFKKRFSDEGERSREDKPFSKRSPSDKKKFDDGDRSRGDRPFKKRFNDENDRSREDRGKRSREGSRENDDRSKRVKYDDFEEGRTFSRRKQEREEFHERKSKPAPKAKQGKDDGLIRLNKYLSNAGIASRREADNLIQSGVVKVNGVVVDQLGYKIKPGDKVTYGDAAVKTERKVYLLLNKPKDYITTVDDPRERKTVMELIEGACRERVYPVGRLDRNTTGLLLFTNDGELTTKLTHPKFGIKKVYHVTLNKGLKAEDFRSIIEGIELEDGIIKADDMAFVGEGKKEIGIEIHSGRNRIVRRIFEHLGYDVLKLDRVVFAGLTKKDLPRGKYRFLTAKEIAFLQMVG